MIPQQSPVGMLSTTDARRPDRGFAPTGLTAGHDASTRKPQAAAHHHDDHTRPQGYAAESLESLLRVLPPWIQDGITAFGDDIEEVTLDLGRPPSLHGRARQAHLTGDVSRSDLHYIIHRVHGFREDNRTGIDRTVHRIACVRDRHGRIVGLTIRVGRALVGVAEIIRDLLCSNDHLLIIGPPGSGKTTLLRDATRILATRWGSRTIVVDTSNEIGGEGRTPHASIGDARRVQVPSPSDQAKILMETLTNHGPQVLIIDELGFRTDISVVMTIARRGIQMLATVHGRSLGDILENPDLAPLVGGIINPAGAGRQRSETPVFNRAVEVRDWQTVVVHYNVARSVDELCSGTPPSMMELRVRAASESSSDGLQGEVVVGSSSPSRLRLRKE